MWPGFLNGNYENSCWLKILITRSYLYYDMCILGPSLYIRYRSIIYMNKTRTCCIFGHIISSISHQRCFPAVVFERSSKPTGPCHHGPTAECQLRTEVVHLGEWSTWSFLRTNHDSPIVFVRKIPHDTRHENQWVHSGMRRSTPNSLFSLWKGLCKEKKQPMDLGKTKENGRIANLHPLHLDTIQGATLLMGKVFGHPTNMPF